MPLTLGVLGDSYRRQLRPLVDRPPIDVLLEKVVPIAAELGIRPLGLDFSVDQCMRYLVDWQRSAIGTATA